MLVVSISLSLQIQRLMMVRLILGRVMQEKDLSVNEQIFHSILIISCLRMRMMDG